MSRFPHAPGSAVNRSHKHGKSAVVAWVAIFLTLLICAFLPEVTAIGWHLFHGNSAKFHEWDVPVPTGWRSFTNGDALYIQRMHRFYFHDRAFSQVVITTLRSTPSGISNYQTQKKSLVEHAGEQGYQFLGEHKIRLKSQDGYCLSFATAKNSQRLWITCDVPVVGLSLDFMGDHIYAPVLDLVIDRIKSSGPAVD